MRGSGGRPNRRKPPPHTLPRPSDLWARGTRQPGNSIGGSLKTAEGRKGHLIYFSTRSWVSVYASYCLPDWMPFPAARS